MVEFGALFQAPMLGGKDVFESPEAEHAALMLDLELAIEMDKHNYKYAFVAEHHALTQYSHLSASEVFIPYVAAQTEQLHVGSGIWPLNPVTNHPVRLAERAAMMDQLSGGRFEFGTGRGAGSWEVGTFMVDPEETKAVWAEVITQFKPMWESSDPRMSDGPGYSHDGPYFETPPRNILPKPLGGGKTHPPLWCAVGNLPTFEKCGQHGVGVLGFNFVFTELEKMRPYVELYKRVIAESEPVGQYANDNFLTSQAVFCLEDPKEAREAFIEARANLLFSLVFFYHDTFKNNGMAVWPEVAPASTMEDVEEMIKSRQIICGSPDEVISQIRDYEDMGVDTIAINVPLGLSRETSLAMVRTFGDKVIPEFDTDPIHRTARCRWGDRAEEMVASDAKASKPFDSSTVKAATA